MMSEPDLQNTPPQGEAGIRWRPIALVGGMLALFLLASPRAVPPPEGWMVDFDQAVAKAGETDRNLLVAFNMRGCGPCTMMDRIVLPEPRINAALKSLVPVRVDIDRQRSIAARFNVMATPTYAVIDAGGNLLDQTMGFVPVETFLEFLRRAATLSADAP